MNIDEMISELKGIKSAIGELTSRRRELEAEILSVVQYNPVGQKTIETALHKIKVIAGVGYKVNQEIASEYSECFPENMHPLKAITKYELDAKKFKQLLMYPELREIAEQFVIEAPKAISIEILS